MATYGINDTIKQLNERVEYFNTYTLTTTSFIGLSSVISGLAVENKKGATYDGGIVQSSVTEKIEADRAKWTVQYKTQLSGGGGESDPYTSQTWTMNMSQVEYPIEKFLSESDASEFQKWKNTDDEHKAKFQYFAAMSQGAGPQYGDLTGRALSAAQKTLNGLEAVLRFYPQATRTSNYKVKHTFSSRAGKLNHIDSTPGSQFDVSCSWLKTGFDWAQNNDTTWTLTETWMGAEKWDNELYGDNPWGFNGT